MKNSKVLVFALSLLGSCALAVSAAAQQRPSTDFNGDGISDFLWVRIQEDGNLAWSYRSSESAERVSLGRFGQNGDHLVPGHWQSPSTPEPAIVRRDPTSEVFSWQLRSGLAHQFGSKNDLIIGGADFDGNGLDDAAIVTTRGKRLIWTIAYNLLASGAGASSYAEIPFGTRGEVPFFTRAAGESTDRISIISIKPRRALLKRKDPITGKRTQAALRKRIALLGRPLPVSQADGGDLLLFLKSVGSSTKVHVVTLAGKRLYTTTLGINGTAVVGDFDLTQPGEELAIRSSSGFILFNPATQFASEILVAAQIPVDHININSFDGEDSGSYVPPGIARCRTYNPNDGSKIGFIWKPNSDTTYFAVAVMPGTLRGKIKKVEVFTQEGQLVKALSYSGCGNPDAAGPRCNYKDYSLTGADYRRRFGSIYLKVSLNAGGCGRYFLKNPAVRVD